MSCFLQFNIILYIFSPVNGNGCLDVGKIRGTDVLGSFEKKLNFVSKFLIYWNFVLN